MQNILVVMEKNSFLPMSMVEQLKELNYNIVSSQLEIQELSKLKETFEVILLFMESDGEEKSKELVYLRDKAVEEEYRGDAVAVDSPEGLELSVSHTHKSQNEQCQAGEEYHCAHKAELLADCAEDKVGMLLRYIVILDLRTLHKALAPKASRANSNLRLVYIISCIFRVLNQTHKGKDSILLMWLELREEEVSGRHKDHCIDKHQDWP